jgi:hypothetical protein
MSFIGTTMIRKAFDLAGVVFDEDGQVTLRK